MRIKQALLTLCLVAGFVGFFAAEASASFVFRKQPVISNVSVSGITSSSATISWSSLVSADSQVEYGVTTSYGILSTLVPTPTRSHIQILGGLTANTVYRFAVLSRTDVGTLYSAGDFTFSTPPVIIDGMISGFSISGITRTSAVISWTTVAPANSLVEFGNTIGYGQNSPLATEFVTSHTVVLSGLWPLVFYHVRAKSADGSGNLGISADFIFTTAEADAQPPFSGIWASASGATSATITWLSTSPSGSQVDYGTGFGYGSSTVMDPTLTTSHTQTLTGLAPDTLYHYRVRSMDGAGNSSISSDYTFSTRPNRAFYPQFAVNPDTYTGVALSNLNLGSAQLSFAAMGAAGSEMLAANFSDPVNRSLGAGAQLAVIQDQLFGSGVSGSWPLGWAMIDSSAPQVAGFFLTFNSTLSFMDGAEISSRLFSSSVLPETGSQDYTTVLIANPNDAAASLEIDLVKTDGTFRSSVRTTIPPFGTYSADLVTGTFAGIAADPSDYVRIVSSQDLRPYEFFGNVSKDFAVLVGEDAADAGSTLYSPQYAAGGPWRSTLSIVNLDATPGTVTLQWIGDDGNQIGFPQTLNIAASGKIFLVDQSIFQAPPASSAQVTQGYLKITSAGLRLAGSVVFSDAAQGLFMTALPLVSTLRQSQVLSHVASNDLYFTGLSILNPNDSSAQVKIDLYTSDGVLDKTTTQNIPAGHRISRLLTEYFPDLVGRDRHSGYLRVTSDTGVGCFGVFGTQSLWVLSAIPAQASQ